MSGIEILADTNLLIRFLSGEPAAERAILANDVYLSFISELELYSKATLGGEEEAAIAQLLSGCTILPYSEQMKHAVIQLRRQSRLKLPDAIIAATAISYKFPLVTSDRDYKPVAGLSIILIS